MGSWRRRLVGTVALVLGAVGCRAPSPTSPETPKPGVPTIELELLNRMNWQGEAACAAGAGEVVDRQRLCSKEHWADCVYAANRYLYGCAVAQDHVLAEQLSRRACSFGSMVGCTMEAYFTEDRAQAITLLETPCARGYAPACGNLGCVLQDRDRAEDVPHAAQLLKAACDDSSRYCPRWGKLVIKWKLAAQYQDAQAHLERACQAKEQTSCRLLAAAYDEGLLGVTDPERAFALYQASCDESDLPSCDALGYLYVRGRGHEKDETEGVRRFYVACTQGYAPGCTSMGRALEKGWAGPADAAQARAYYKRACELGSEIDCHGVRRLGAKK
ncbi:MAG: hypothetical protein RL685_783 [Pseudomonadota bacterium]|jgi:TPR repeat protein